MRVSVCAARLKMSPPRSVRTKSEMVRVLQTVRHPQVRCKEARHDKLSHDLVLTATLYRHANIKRCACSLKHVTVCSSRQRDCPWPARTKKSSLEKPVSWNSTFLPTPSSSAIGTLCFKPLCPTASPVTPRKFKVVTLGSIQCSERSSTKKA